MPTTAIGGSVVLSRYRKKQGDALDAQENQSLFSPLPLRGAPGEPSSYRRRHRDCLQCVQGCYADYSRIANVQGVAVITVDSPLAWLRITPSTDEGFA